MMVVLETEARASCILCKASTSEIHSQPSRSLVITLSSPKDSTKFKDGTIWAMGMTQLIKSLLCMPEDLSSTPSSVQKAKDGSGHLIPPPGRWKPQNPEGSLASQSHHLVAAGLLRDLASKTR